MCSVIIVHVYCMHTCDLAEAGSPRPRITLGGVFAGLAWTRLPDTENGGLQVWG